MIFVIIARIVMQLLRNKREKAKKVDFSGSLVRFFFWFPKG
jgi:hypothetical protein